MRIRRATESDAGPLARLAERSFRDAFAEVNSPEDTDLFCSQVYGPKIQLAEIQDPDMSTLVAEASEGLAGFAQVRAKAAKDCVPDACPAELRRLYLDQRWLGKGVADQLMHSVLQQAGATAARWIWLGVWEHNPRAIAFYRRYGFTEHGEHRFLLGRDPQRDLIFARPLDGQGC